MHTEELPSTSMQQLTWKAVHQTSLFPLSHFSPSIMSPLAITHRIKLLWQHSMRTLFRMQTFTQHPLLLLFFLLLFGNRKFSCLVFCVLCDTDFICIHSTENIEFCMISIIPGQRHLCVVDSVLSFWIWIILLTDLICHLACLEMIFDIFFWGYKVWNTVKESDPKQFCPSQQDQQKICTNTKSLILKSNQNIVPFDNSTPKMF